MCTQNPLQQHIRRLTNDGELIARFLTDTVQGKTPGAKACHQMDAIKCLVRFGIDDRHESDDAQFWGMLPTPEELAAKKQDEPEQPESEITYLDILNYDLAQLIRSETEEGHTIVQFLTDTLTGEDKPFTPNKLKIKPADRMSACKEILRRGYGHFGRRRKLIDDAEDANEYDTLHTDLAKRMRQYSERGSAAIRFLLEVMENTDPKEEYTHHHRVSAALELMRRGWDTNYDKITAQHLTAYWQDRQQREETPAHPVNPVSSRPGSSRMEEDHEPIMSNPSPSGEGLAWGYGVLPAKHDPAPNRAAENRQKNNRQQDRKENLPHLVNPVSYHHNEDDCYYEPLNPEDQVIFDYQTLIESGARKEGEIQPQPVTEEIRLGYQATLQWMRETAQSKGVPLLPNPLSGTLTRPKARSP